MQVIMISVCVFQSTLPTRGSDSNSYFLLASNVDFNPRSPRGGATIYQPCHFLVFLFQSTLPTRGSDFFFYYGVTSAINFNPRSPRGGATQDHQHNHYYWHYFNPRSPRGGATTYRSYHALRHEFQSTLPTRGSDHKTWTLCFSPSHFNPRSPRGGATLCLGGRCLSSKFQSTLPTRGSDVQKVFDRCF